jgi:hypothetical protein
VEADLRTRLAASEAARVVAVRDKTLLGAQVSALITANNSLNKKLAAIYEAASDSQVDSRTAVAKAQAESAQTLSNTDFSVKSQAEFEKQLTRVEVDVHSTVTAQRYETMLLVVMTIILFSFTGFLAYSTWRIRITNKVNTDATGKV